MTDEVMPRLKARFSLRQIVHRTLITAGLAESMLAEKIADWENALPPYLHLAYLPAPGVVRLRLSAYEVEGESVSHEIDRQFAALQRIIPRYVLGFERATMQEIVHNLLTRRRQTLATAESCTGGSIAARFTAIPGASAYFLCGVVAYSNESKKQPVGCRSRNDRLPGRRQRGGRTADGRRSTPHRRSRLCRRNHRHRRSCGRHGTETRRHGLDGRSRPAPYRDPAQTMRHRPGTNHRPGERLRTRAPARRNRTGCRRRITRFRHFPKPLTSGASKGSGSLHIPVSGTSPVPPGTHPTLSDTLSGRTPRKSRNKSPIRSLAPSDEIQRRIIEHTPSKRVNSPTVITGTSYRYISNIRLPKPKFEAIPEQILPPGQRQNHPVIPTAPLSARFSETRERP